MKLCKRACLEIIGLVAYVAMYYFYGHDRRLVQQFILSQFHTMLMVAIAGAADCALVSRAN